VVSQSALPNRLSIRSASSRVNSPAPSIQSRSSPGKHVTGELSVPGRRSASARVARPLKSRQRTDGQTGRATPHSFCH
jgi:hypothetical protein